ncbi:hypothetical protein [Jiangella endophytica]|nr:hypothetical protein [Jiangella endophytica]
MIGRRTALVRYLGTGSRHVHLDLDPDCPPDPDPDVRCPLEGDLA